MIGSDRPGTPVKIGVAADVLSRLRKLQTGNPMPLKVLLSIELTPDVVRKAEGSCHRLLRDKRILGEWFDAEADSAISLVNSVVRDRLWERCRNEANGGLAVLQMRVSDDFKDLIVRMAEEDQLSLTSFMLMLAAKEARARGITPPSSPSRVKRRRSPPGDAPGRP